MRPYEFTLAPGGIQHANFLPFIGAALSGAAGLIGGAASLAGGAVSALGSAAGYLGSTAIGAGGTILGGIGSLGTGIIDTSAGLVKGAGTALFGGGAVTPGLTIGEQMAAIAEPGFYETAAGGGLFSNLSWDTLGNIASAGYSIYQSSEDRKLTEKAIEAQRRAGYLIPGAPTTALAPTTSVVIPAARAAEGLLRTEEQSKIIKYAVIAIGAYLLLKGVK